MKKSIGVFLIFCFLSMSPLTVALAQYDTKKKSLPPGKETITIEGIERTVNKDAILTQQGSTTFVEGYKSNIARRLAASEDNIVKLQQELQAAKIEIQQIKQELLSEHTARANLEAKVKHLEIPSNQSSNPSSNK